MAVEQFIKQGDSDLADHDYLSAISLYSKAINENPKAFQAFLKRSIAYQRLKNFDSAKKDISEAFTIAEQRGRREEIGQCYFRLGITYYNEKNYKLALKNMKKAEEFNYTDVALQTWILKCERDLKKNPSVEDAEEDEDLVGSIGDNKKPSDDTKKEQKGASESQEEKKSTNIDVINQLAPLKAKIREDWYQSNDEVIITIYAKGVKEADFNINFAKSSVNVSFPNGANSEYNYNLEPLYAPIDVEKSTFKIYSTKVEIVLAKVEHIKWSTLEGSGESSDLVQRPIDSDSGSALVYPSASKKKINWANFKLDDEEDATGENDFFAKLYGDADEETKRAMMKSYVESNGTVLTTDWSEAKNKKFETSPPEGMQAKKWN